MPPEQVTGVDVEDGQIRDKVFISYSHEDSKWLKRLQIFLKPLVRDQGLDVWDDTQIAAGSKWKEEIQQALATTKVAVLLVSADFLASDFIMRKEVPRFLEAAEEEGAIILWIPISASLYETSPIGQYQALIKPSQPLDSLKKSDRNKVLTEIAKKIKKNMDSPLK